MTMMSRLLYNVFQDGESLLEYERCGPCSVKISDIHRRLIAMERIADGGKKTDSFYDGMGAVDLKDFNSIVSMMCELPRKLGDNFLMKVQNTIYVKEECFYEWGLLCCKLSPLWVIAGFLSKNISIDIFNERDTLRPFVKRETAQFRNSALLAPYIPDLDYFVRQVGGLNDLHVHLNGSTEIDVIWNYMLSHPYQISSDYKKSFYKNTNLRKHAEQIMQGFSPELLLRRLLYAVSLRNRLLELLYRKYSGLVYIKCNLQDELLLYVLLIKHIAYYRDERAAKLFHYYLLIKGLIQSFVIMQQSQIGFSQFQLITDNTFRYRPEFYYKNRFLQLSSGCGRRFINTIEGRFSPQVSVWENYQLTKRIFNGFEQAKVERKEQLNDAELILIAHFIKRPETPSEKTHFIRNYYLRKELRNKAVNLLMFVKEYPKFGNMIKGVDAAASEFDTKPEVFAPTFSFLRESGFSHFTYHVGEDFCHLISGFRYVYEAIKFLHLRSGDRLGHCTALGICPELWVNKVGMFTYISRGEWLDDLVFIWYLVKNDYLNLSQSTMYKIESKIEELAVIIYGDVFLPYELVEAWLLREYVPNEELNSYYPRYSYENYIHNVIIKKYLKGDTKSRAASIWFKYHEGVKYHFSNGERISLGCRNLYDETIKIASEEIISVIELKQIQKAMLDMISDKNVIIEALPTSNMRISLYDCLKDYHLVNWLNDEREGGLLPTVVLGSDDPGIFMTNIYNEYALAYIHLKMNKFAPAKRLEKIRYIHEHSEIYCFRDGKE